METNGDLTTIEIAQSKRKLSLIFLGSVAFVIFGCLFIANPATFAHNDSQKTVLVLITGIMAVIFFGTFAVFSFFKLFDNKPGLIIDEHGVTDNSAIFSFGRVDWCDITRLSVKQVANQRLIMVTVKNPEEYLLRPKWWLAKRLLSANYKYYETPLTMQAKGLACSFDELYRLLYSSFEKYRQAPAEI